MRDAVAFGVDVGAALGFLMMSATELVSQMSSPAKLLLGSCRVSELPVPESEYPLQLPSFYFCCKSFAISTVFTILAAYFRSIIFKKTISCKLCVCSERSIYENPFVSAKSFAFSLSEQITRSFVALSNTSSSIADKHSEIYNFFQRRKIDAIKVIIPNRYHIRHQQIL